MAMAKKARQRISYGKPALRNHVSCSPHPTRTLSSYLSSLRKSSPWSRLPIFLSSLTNWAVLENGKSSAGGHRLGVNGLAVDSTNGILYSGGRDGIVCAWDLNLSTEPSPTTASTFRAQTQAHMHWINDIALAQNNTVVVSGSSDLSVKVWRPHSEENSTAHTIGEHADYVKCVVASTTDTTSNTIVAAGLDRKICWWDLNGKGKSLEIDVKGEEIPEKGSVYSLALGRSIVASGGPEKTIRLHDPRSGAEVSKLMGHLGNIRSLLIDDADDTILSASADKTIKLWSVRGGRCMYTFNMHDESVWSLFSNDPRLGIFYSSDRNGMVAKTDIRGSFDEVDNGLSLALAQEHIGVSKLVAAHGHFWTATNRSSINRWSDFDVEQEMDLPQDHRHRRAVSAMSSKARQTSPSTTDGPKKEINPQSILKLSNMGMYLPRSNTDGEAINDGPSRRPSIIPATEPEPEIKTIFNTPEETIEGQFGLLKHKLLNDRKRVLTLDTAGDVLLWDLIQCKPVQSFGKQHLEDVADVLNTRAAVAPWCSVDLSSGNLTVILEPYNCFDAEVYGDELELEDKIEFREDQRISLGRWILRYLFANLVDEEIKRDEAYRHKINEEVEKRIAAAVSSAPALSPGLASLAVMDDPATPRADGLQPAMTPGIGIVGTPAVAVESSSTSQAGRPSADKGDYFTAGISPVENPAAVKTPVPTPAPAPASAPEAAEGKTSSDNTEKLKEKEKPTEGAKSPSTPFGKKFRMSFSTKKLGRSGSQATQEKPVVVDEKAVESETSSSHEKEVDDSFYGIIQKIRNEYDRQLTESPDKLVETRVTPSLPADTPVLKLPPGTKVIIQEETSGGSSNVYQGTVESVGRDADIIEQKAPMWLGDLLLQNQVPFKEPVKISFVLHPLDGLPIIATDGSSRLNANRMLRVKKILGYVAERIEPAPGADEDADSQMEPEEYLELYCNEQLLEPTLTLATLRTHIWKGGNDVVLYYKTNGRRKLRPMPVPEPEQQPEPQQAPEEIPASPATAVAA
ncbi:WD repeat protein [Cordyceps militaris CM01]|uniref:WD repeat protein n=1 Tax=Cordyceps militaris (strain CM01) TaxID=983644 RepID=G3JL01_CORMM|nr:WD repeat protein [Cordyceps militaris CM01]EGX90375.1 WD repeat protein [Cordyceps militaris CM01]